jgi:hypothetical protein
MARQQASGFEAMTVRVSSWVAAAKNLGSLAAAGSLLIVGLSGYLASSDAPLWCRFTAAVAAGVALGCLIGALLHRFVFRRKEVPLGYLWKKAKYTYRFGADDVRSQTQDLEVDIQSRRSNLTIFLNKFYWTGDSNGRKPEIEVTSPGQVLLTDCSLVHDLWQFYYIHFKKPLQFGETTTVRVTQKMFDERGVFKPTLSKYVHEKMESLTLQVVFGKYMPPEESFLAVIRSSFMGDAQVLGYGEIEYEKSTKCVRYVINAPRKGRTYAIEWDWNYPN